MRGGTEAARGVRGGFTLLEVGAVLGVMAIGAALAMPDILALRRGQELEAAARDMLFALRAAQLRSVTSGRRMRLALEPARGSGWSWGLESESGGSWLPEGGAHRVPQGIEVTVAGPSPKVFNPDGTSSIGSLTLAASGGRYYRIAFSPITGRIRLWRGARELGRAR